MKAAAVSPVASQTEAGMDSGAAWCLGAVVVLVLVSSLHGGERDPFEDLETPKGPSVMQATPQPDAEETGAKNWARDLFRENFTFKKEILSQFSHSDEWYSRQSVGGEVLKKFSTATATVAAVNGQFRLLRRDNPIEVMNDHEGMDREGWYAEYHNLYLDLYNVLNPILSDEAKGANVGRFNFRAGHFYLPMGLNLQTDTHATVFQLSNARNFGFERDWYAGFWGALNEYLNCDVYYLAGSGYHLSSKGQDGLLGVRLSLADSFDVDHGLQAGLAFMGGSGSPRRPSSAAPRWPPRPSMARSWIPCA